MADDDSGFFTDSENRKLLNAMRQRDALSKIDEKRQLKILAAQDKFTKQRRILEVATRSSMGGGMMGAGMQFMQGMGGLKLQDFQEKQQLGNEGGMFHKDLESRNRFNDLSKSKGVGGIEKLDKLFEKTFGGNSKWNKAFGGHGKAAAGGMAMGAAGGGMALGKMIIDSSPLLQQMLKLLQFGIMLVLKPIGDFFGMMFRPILILLLRKFIIPNYQKIMPMMLKMGAEIGEMLVGFLNFFTGDWIKNINWGEVANTALKLLIPAYGIGSVLYDYFKDNPIDWSAIFPAIDWNNVLPKLDTTVIDKSWGKVVDFYGDMGIDLTSMEGYWNSLNKFWTSVGTGVKDNLQGYWDRLVGFYKGVYDTVKGSLEGYWNKVTSFWLGVSQDVTGWVKEKWDKITKFFSILDSDVGGWVKEKWDSFTSFISDKLGGIWNSLGKHWNNFVSFFASIGNGTKHLLQSFGIIAAADGFDGMVNKPTMFLAGERGSEHVKVTPHGQSSGGGGGTTININISNMSGDSNDLNKLRSTILEVMQSVNVNRGR